MGAVWFTAFPGMMWACSDVIFVADPPPGQQYGPWCLAPIDLAKLFKLPRLPELMKEAIKTIFQPRWGRGRWRSKT